MKPLLLIDRRRTLMLYFLHLMWHGPALATITIQVIKIVPTTPRFKSSLPSPTIHCRRRKPIKTALLHCASPVLRMHQTSCSLVLLDLVWRNEHFLDGQRWNEGYCSGMDRIRRCLLEAVRAFQRVAFSLQKHARCVADFQGIVRAVMVCVGSALSCCRVSCLRELLLLQMLLPLEVVAATSTCDTAVILGEFLAPSMPLRCQH